MSVVQQSMIEGQPRKMLEAIPMNNSHEDGAGAAPYPRAGRTGHGTLPGDNPVAQQLARVAEELERALQALVDANLVAVRRHEFWLEVEVRTDILFASGDARLSDKAIPALDALAGTLVKYPNPVRVEGHTDNQPINTRHFPSNWELSAARAANVVHRFARAGISPQRLSMIGFGEYRPAQSNDTAAGRDANRRVIIVILAGEGAPAPSDVASVTADTAATPADAAATTAADAQAQPVN